MKRQFKKKAVFRFLLSRANLDLLPRVHNLFSLFLRLHPDSLYTKFDIISEKKKHHPKRFKTPLVCFSLHCERLTLHFTRLPPPASPRQHNLVNMNRVCIRDPISGEGGAAIGAETHRSILQNRLTGELGERRGDEK